MKATAAALAWIARQAPAIAVAVIVVALALASGGYGGAALGIATVAVWVGFVVAALGPGRERLLGRSFLLAAAALALIAVLAAFSLGWTLDRGTGFSDVVRLAAYLGAFGLGGLLLGPGSGRSALVGLAFGLVAVCLVALGSRLLGIGGGDAELVASMPSSAGRLSYPIGYWNALGALAAMAVPVLVWIASEGRSRSACALGLAAMPPVLLTAYMTSSRGALIAAAIGAVVAIAAARSRSRALAALVAGSIAAAPSLIAATFGDGILDEPLTTPGRAELVVVATLGLGIVLALVIGPPAVGRGSTIRIAGLRMRHALVAALAVAAALIALAGPAEIAGDFAATSGREATSGGDQLSVTGSGRAQFWSAALEAFRDDPLKGIGAGGFGLWWNMHGSLETPVQNAHSEPLELLAELGPVALLAFVAFFAAVAAEGIARARRPGGGAAGAALGVIATGLVGILIDWTWELPVVAVCLILAAALLTTRAFDRPGVVPTPLRGVRVPASFVAVAVAALAIPAVWAGGVLAVASDRLAAVDDATGAGRLDEAAAAARSAAIVEPWAAEPWVRLANIEQAAGNLAAARLDGRRAIELTPDDSRSWVLLGVIEAALGERKVAFAYLDRALDLAPLVIPRAVRMSGRSGPSGS
ncbi:MAG: O-antigen ligase family protein [Solirubrobacterales bacterium]